MLKRLGLPLLAVLAVCSFALNAADTEIEQLKQMIRAQNAKIEKLERAQGSSQASAAVDKAVGSRHPCYLAPDRPDVGVGLSFKGEYLYWKSNASQNTYAYLGDVDGFANLGHARDVDTGWSHGFRLGLDYRLPYDGWNIGADYTYYRADGESSVTVTPAENAAGTYLYPANGFNATGLEGPAGADIVLGHAKATADLDFDRVNFEIGRNTKISETLSVRFFGGGSVIWVDAKTQESFYAQGVAIDGLGYHHSASDKATYYGIRAGLDAEMKLKYGFSLLGKAAGSMLVGDLETSAIAGFDLNVDGVLTRDETYGDTKNSAYRVVPGLELEAGVAWERKILDGLNLKVFAGYQFSDYIGAMERLDADLPNNFAANNRVVNRESDLVLHGVVFRVKLDF